jgi:integrase
LLSVGHAQGRKGKAPTSQASAQGQSATARMKAFFRPTAIRANRVGEILRKLFNLAIRWKMRADTLRWDSPAIRRYRAIAIDEIKRLTDVLATHSNRRCANIIRLNLLAGARRGEAITHAGTNWTSMTRSGRSPPQRRSSFEGERRRAWPHAQMGERINSIQRCAGCPRAWSRQ